MQFVSRATPLYGFLRLCNNSNLERRVLDCGAGGVQPPLYLFSQYGYQTFGIDINKNAIKNSEDFCKKNKLNVDLNIKLGDMREIEYEDGTDTLLHLVLDEEKEHFEIPVSNMVAGLIADPGNWIIDKTKLIRRYISGGHFYVSPNPFEGQLNVVFSTDASREISLADMNGKIVQKWNSFSAQVVLDTDRVNKGLYLLQVKEGNDSYSAKVVKQ